MAIALIDYKAGNLTSVRKALAAIGAQVYTPLEPRELADANGIIVPGVGHFNATRALDRSWVDAILECVSLGRPLLGICLGMQWLFESSAEAPELKGLGVLSGVCSRLRTERPQPDPECDRTVRLQPEREMDIKVPHVGWNSLALHREAWITEGVPNGAQVYFTHSFIAPITGDTIAVTEHGEPFAAVVQRSHIAGVQFHPEKSGEIGLRILGNFTRLAG